MLKSLLIRNYALIDRLEMAPAEGLNIITGETGAGKSIMLGALGLVMGNRADAKALFHKEEKCVVEATYEMTDDTLRPILEEAGADFEPETILRREISPQGKSRAFVNDTPVSLDALRKVSDALIDIHSQHDTLQLGSAAYQLSLVDAYAGLQTQAAEVATAYRAYRAARQELEALTERLKAAARERDFNAFQYEELSAANLVPGEAESLESEQALLTNSEDIKLRLAQATELLQAGTPGSPDVLTSLKQAAQLIDKIGGLSPALGQIAERLQSTLLELRDVAGELEAEADRAELDPERMMQVQERLNQLNLLFKKHGAGTEAELIALRDQYQAALAGLENMDEQLAFLKTEADRQLSAAQAKAQALSKQRQAALPALEKEIGVLLTEVGMPNARLQAEHSAVELSATGMDRVRLLFSANKGVAPQELKNAASGGEFSRLMLCVKYVLAGKTELPTLIFDEIDTGISGEIAVRVGRLMQRMARRHQLIVITHMPQIAAKGSRHYYVYKNEQTERTFTNIRELEGEDRLSEIAQMIGGANPSQTAISSAKELMAEPV